MSDADPNSELDGADLVHWSPRHGPTVGGPVRPLALPLSALGLVAVFGLAVGALAIGRLAVGQARLAEVRIDRLDVGELVLARRNPRPV